MAKVNFNSSVARVNMLWLLFASLWFISESQGVELKWYGAGNITIADEDSVVIFDPFISRPSFRKVITNQQLESDEELEREIFGQYRQKKNIGIFITHNHYDHILDLPSTMKLLGFPKTVAPPETTKILKAFEFPKQSIEVVNDKARQYEVGKFKIKAYEVTHSKLPLNFSFAQGEMTKDPSWPLGAFDIKSVKNYGYHIRHPDGDILYHPTSEPYNYDISEVDTLIIGLTSPSIEELRRTVVKKVNHRQLITVHNDNFFKPFKAPVTRMPFLPKGKKKLTGILPKTYDIEAKASDQEKTKNKESITESKS